MNGLEAAAEKYDVGDAWNDTDEIVQIDVKRTLDKVIPVRLSADKWEELRAEARELGVGPTTLVRVWVLEKLRELRRSESGRPAV
jgi:hypothetical protein